jgi:hypothetical protein
MKSKHITMRKYTTYSDWLAEREKMLAITSKSKLNLRCLAVNVRPAPNKLGHSIYDTRVEIRDANDKLLTYKVIKTAEELSTFLNSHREPTPTVKPIIIDHLSPTPPKPIEIIAILTSEEPALPPHFSPFPNSLQTESIASIERVAKFVMELNLTTGIYDIIVVRTKDNHDTLYAGYWNDGTLP